MMQNSFFIHGLSFVFGVLLATKICDASSVALEADTPPIVANINSFVADSCSNNSIGNRGARAGPAAAEISHDSDASSTSIDPFDVPTNSQKTLKNQDHMIPRPDPSIVGYPVSRFSPDRRRVDPVQTVRVEHTSQNPLGVSAQEWQARTELAAAYRYLFLSGLGSDQAAQCLMHRVPPLQEEDNTNATAITFLMADWGIWFEEVTASNLLHFTVNGEQIVMDQRKRRRVRKLVPSDPHTANTGCIPVAKAIFESRPDVNTIVHIHPQAVMAVSGLEVGLLPLSQAAFFLWGQVSREDYDFSYETSFETNLASGFANGERAMLLNHHGMYAVGPDIAGAIFVATHLNQACEVQVRTLSAAGGDLTKLILHTGKDLDQQYKDMMDSTDYSYNGSREWPGIVRKVMREAPDFNL